MVQDSISKAIARHSLDPHFTRTVEHWYLPLAQDIASAQKNAASCLFVGVQGCQGSGKSTLADFVKILLETRFQLSVATVSIDDFYLTLAARKQLASDVHPLLRTRGVPGTHDLPLAHDTFERLLTLQAGAGVALPRFDKARDDRSQPEAWPTVNGPIDVIIFEGWCVGVSPQTDAELEAPINELESKEDAEGIWRRYVNAQLADAYCHLFSLIDKLAVLNAPSFDCVYRWRALQEEKLAQKIAREKLNGDARAQTPAELKRFISHYERLTRHCIASMPARADWLLPLNENHEIRDLIRKS